MRDDNTQMKRRRFLKATTAGGIVGMTALAGCSDQGGDGAGGDNTGGGANNSGPGSGLSTYTYVNNAQSYNPPRHDAINLIADQLNKLGLDVEVDVLEWGTLYSRVSEEYNYSFATWHTFFVSEPVMELNNLFNSENTGAGQGNYSGYENPELDKMMANYLAEPNSDTRVELAHKIQRTLMDDVPTMPITQMPQAAIYNKNQVGNWEADLANGFNSYWTMINLEMKGGEDTLKGYWPETLSTMNVLGHNDESKHVYQFNVMYDFLVQINNNAEPDPEVSLATDWNRVDETTMEYTIRTDHSWHDGENLTAEDVAFTYNYINENEVPLYSTQSEYIDNAEVIDEETVRINMSEPLGPFNLAVANLIPIIPEHMWADRNNPSQANIQEPVGSGPMMFDYWEQGSEFGLSKFTEHFAPVDFEKRFWRVIPEASTVWENLINGDLNYEPFGRIDRSLDQNQNNENIGTTFQTAPTFWMFTPNEREKGLGDKQLRKAMVETIPRTPIVKQILFGLPDPGFNIVSSAFGSLHTEDVPTYKESREAARNRLKEAGYTWNDDGMLQAPSND
ncbi:ABC transporter substrate-binding protein [Halegenticoccus tardaugens]|uniref:ABC transporter substrate-binding protein n=1 Tax=Halegenticoccus tardaugens TaxID=2071624 RepID=UPI001E350EA5|nr:ABC transporter substrate-binding protein [Halegenticoccus tardaugens]